MTERIDAELQLIRQRFPGATYQPEGFWVRIPDYALPAGWSHTATDVAFQVPPAYPGTPPYGIYVPSGLSIDGAAPDNYKEPADNQPPFGGAWGVFSWAPMDGEWRPTAELQRGSNLLNWIIGFADRFREGR